MSARPPSSSATIVAFALSALVSTVAVVASVRATSASHAAVAPTAAPSFTGATPVDASLPSATSVVIDDMAAGEPAPTF